MAPKQRIAYIDFMKGLCIILVVAFHCGITSLGDHVNNMLQQFRIPMYFFLSGLFFKLYDGFVDFTRRKVNNIIIPLIFFLLIGLVYAVVRNLGETHFNVAAAIAKLPSNPIHLNGPMWFLVALFEVNIIYYLLQKFLPRWATIACAVALSAIGYAIVRNGYLLEPYLDIAFVAMPFFILGSEAKRNNLLTSGPNVWVRIAFAVIVFFLLYFFAGEINMSARHYPNYFLLYLLPGVAILSLMFICQYIKKPVPLISYLGRYSIIVLGTHYFVLFPCKAVLAKVLGLPSSGSVPLFLMTLAVTLAAEFPIIYLLKKYVPRLTAQEEFFRAGWKVGRASAEPQ